MDGRPEGVIQAPGATSTATSGAATRDRVEPPAVAAPNPTAPRQRWRLVLARAATVDGTSGRELAEAWDRALDSSGLPLYRAAGRPRPRIHFGAPVPAGMALERELADVVLSELFPRWRAREMFESVMPDGWRLVDLYDVWPGQPPLSGQVAAADYRLEIDGAHADSLATAAARLLSVRSLPRVRPKGTETVRYDLRPLLADVIVVAEGPPAVVRVRTRFDPALGTGRPDEVVAALGDASGSVLEIRTIVRERILTAGELEDAAGRIAAG